MRIWARVVYILMFAIVATLPFNPLLNHPFIVFPSSLICIVFGLIAVYYSTFPENPKHTGNGGAK